MSNYHYNGQSGRGENGKYLNLKNTATYNCDLDCMCKHTDERSDKDRMYYNWFVLDQPVQLPPPGQQIKQPKNNMCKN